MIETSGGCDLLPQDAVQDAKFSREGGVLPRYPQKTPHQQQWVGLHQPENLWAMVQTIIGGAGMGYHAVKGSSLRYTGMSLMGSKAPQQFTVLSCNVSVAIQTGIKHFAGFRSSSHADLIWLNFLQIGKFRCPAENLKLHLFAPSVQKLTDWIHLLAQWNHCWRRLTDKENSLFPCSSIVYCWTLCISAE